MGRGLLVLVEDPAAVLESLVFSPRIVIPVNLDSPGSMLKTSSLDQSSSSICLHSSSRLAEATIG